MKKDLGGVKVLLVILVIVIVIAGVLLALKIFKGEDVSNIGDVFSNIIPIGNTDKEKEIQIYNGKERPIAIMLDNHPSARPHGGLNDAYAVYEIIVEGGMTRLMAVFKGVEPEKIGPVRSCRHYFLDYALENDAIYAHYGWSPKGESDISSLGVNNINGLIETHCYWRVNDKSAPHNVGTTIETLMEVAENHGYRTTSTSDSVLKYVADEIDLEEGQSALEIEIPYPTETVKFVYNEDIKRYERYVAGKLQKDWATEETITTKNIIITFAQNVSLDSDGRQDLKNIGDLDGYYITNGKAIKIICSKESRTDKTVYKDLEGNVIEVNDGNTFFQICPLTFNVKIQGAEEDSSSQDNNTNTVNTI